MIVVKSSSLCRGQEAPSLWAGHYLRVPLCCVDLTIKLLSRRVTLGIGHLSLDVIAVHSVYLWHISVFKNCI